jgi:hypothetical protein
MQPGEKKNEKTEKNLNWMPRRENGKKKEIEKSKREEIMKAGAKPSRFEKTSKWEQTNKN